MRAELDCPTGCVFKVAPLAPPQPYPCPNPNPSPNPLPLPLT